MNAPPINNESPLTANAFTLPFAVGLNANAPPVDVDIEAILARAAPPILANEPPTNKFVPERARALTDPSALGFHPVATPVEPLT